ncbi:TPA: hypothetical protein I9Z77_001515 [Clostridium perfringens]|nr:hypothetical protein [Clostridium perfringens]
MRIFRKRSIETRINDVVIREVEVDETKNGYLNILEIMECPEENVIEDDYKEEV